jgi:hypothetical protein
MDFWVLSYCDDDTCSTQEYGSVAFANAGVTGERPESTSAVLADFDNSGTIDMADWAMMLLTWGVSQGLLELYEGLSGSGYGYTASWDDIGIQTIALTGESIPQGDPIGYNIAYSDFRKITARAFFEMPVGRRIQLHHRSSYSSPIPTGVCSKHQRFNWSIEHQF